MSLTASPRQCAARLVSVVRLFAVGALPADLRLLVGRTLALLYCRPWLRQYLHVRTMLDWAQQPCPSIVSNVACFKLWCGRAHLEFLQTYASGDLTPLRLRRPVFMLVLDDRVLHRSPRKADGLD